MTTNCSYSSLSHGIIQGYVNNPATQDDPGVTSTEAASIRHKEQAS